MSAPQWRERPDRPIYEDPRLEPVAKLVPYYRNMWLDADFNEQHQEVIDAYKRQYEYYKQLLNEGKHYEPKF